MKKIVKLADSLPPPDFVELSPTEFRLVELAQRLRDERVASANRDFSSEVLRLADEKGLKPPELKPGQHPDVRVELQAKGAPRLVVRVVGP